jgi:hypothetical protein
MSYLYKTCKRNQLNNLQSCDLYTILVSMLVPFQSKILSVNNAVYVLVHSL